MLFLSAIFACCLLALDAGRRYERRSAVRFAERIKQEKLLLSVCSDFQKLIDDSCDSRNSDGFQSILGDYAGYGLSIDDMSSGFRLAFMSDDELRSNELSNIVFLPGKANCYISRRNEVGLTECDTGIDAFLQDEARQTCVRYGWINPVQSNGFGFASISKKYKKSTLKELFPLVNELPLINVNFANKEVLRYYLVRSGIGERDSGEKATAIFELADSSEVDLTSLKGLLGERCYSALASYFGVRTSFWKIACECNGVGLEGIVCAIPEKESGNPSIDRYELLEWRQSDAR
jgi:hypothetical protein